MHIQVYLHFVIFGSLSMDHMAAWTFWVPGLSSLGAHFRTGARRAEVKAWLAQKAHVSLGPTSLTGDSVGGYMSHGQNSL